MPAGKYRPLVRYLTALPPEQEQVSLTFGELAAVIGPLPRAADQPSFWSGTQARRNWEPYGFSARLAPDRDAVQFTRVRTALPEACALCDHPPWAAIRCADARRAPARP